MTDGFHTTAFSLERKELKSFSVKLKMISMALLFPITFNLQSFTNMADINRKLLLLHILRLNILSILLLRRQKTHRDITSRKKIVGKEAL